MPKGTHQIIFPQYIDATLSSTDGRRIGKAMSVSKPTPEELYVACTQLGLKCYVDPTKSFPRSQAQLAQMPAPRGCLFVQISEARGSEETRVPCNAEVANKQQLLKKIAGLIIAKDPKRAGTEVPRVEEVRSRAAKALDCEAASHPVASPATIKRKK